MSLLNFHKMYHFSYKPFKDLFVELFLACPLFMLAESQKSVRKLFFSSELNNRMRSVSKPLFS
jgi:hypothetical protein